MFHTNVVEKVKTHFFFFFRKSTVRKIMWKILYSRTGHRWQYGACTWHAGYLKVTNIHSQYEILIALPLRKWLHKRGSVFRYTYSACLVGTSHYIWMTSLTPSGIMNEIWCEVKQTAFSEHWCFNYFFVEDFLKAIFLTCKIFYSLKSNK